jgi:hypothetical protein
MTVQDTKASLAQSLVLLLRRYCWLNTLSVTPSHSQSPREHAYFRDSAMTIQDAKASLARSLVPLLRRLRFLTKVSIASTLQHLFHTVEIKGHKSATPYEDLHQHRAAETSEANRQRNRSKTSQFLKPTTQIGFCPFCSCTSVPRRST